jgi:centractin
MVGKLEGETFIGKKAEELRGLLKIKYPISHGIVQDWNDMESIWTHTYNELRCRAEEV